MHIFHPANLGLTTTVESQNVSQTNPKLSTVFAPYFPGKKLYFIPSGSSLITKLALNILAYLTLGLIHRLKSFEDCWSLYTKGLKIAAIKIQFNPIQTSSDKVRNVLLVFQTASDKVLNVLNQSLDLTTQQLEQNKIDYTASIQNAKTQLGTLQLHNPSLAEAINIVLSAHDKTWPASDNEQEALRKIKVTFDDVIKVIQNELATIN